MVRPRLRRRVRGNFSATFFKPAGVPVRALETVRLSFDELEAIRLADLEELYQADAAEKMNVSRQTLGNILKSARKKIAQALVKGQAIEIDGGTVEYMRNIYFCSTCASEFSSEEALDECPECQVPDSESEDDENN